MRIISQDGTIDVPYEQVSIEIKENEIWCGYYATLAQHLIAKKFAEYSTETKTQKAMEMLHNSYYEHELEKIYHEGNNYIHPTFQFPADEDLEVQDEQ